MLTTSPTAARWPALNQHFGLVGFFIMWPLNVSGIFTTIAFFSCPHVMCVSFVYLCCLPLTVCHGLQCARNNLPSHSPVLLYILKWLLRLLLCITAGNEPCPL